MTGPSKTIVVVEDEQDTAEMFAEMMRVSGYHVLKASGSASAMALISEQKPDVVVLDIMMPDFSGLEILNYMQREPHLAHIPVVVVSAQSTPADIRTCMDAGAALYLTKPVGYKDLIQALEKVLQGSHPTGSA